MLEIGGRGMTDLQNKKELNYYEENEVMKDADLYLKEIDTEILTIKNDMIFSYLFNESKMENIEWAVSKILDCDIEKVRNKAKVCRFISRNRFGKWLINRT